MNVKHWKLICDKLIINKDTSILIELIDLLEIEQQQQQQVKEEGEGEEEEEDEYCKEKLSFIQSILYLIELIGKCRIRANELKRLFELLKPSKKFKHISLILRTILNISKINEASCILLNDHLFDFIYSDYKIPLNLLSYNDLISSHFNNTNSHLFSNALVNNLKTSLYFIDFQTQNSGIRVPSISKWPSNAFTFSVWLRLRDANLKRQRRQLYAFYNNSNGIGFEAFLTHDASSLILSTTCNNNNNNKKEFTSVQLLDINLIDNKSKLGNGSRWQLLIIQYIPARNPFASNQLLVYLNGRLFKEITNIKYPYLNQQFNQISICASCAQVKSTQSTSSSSSSSISNYLLSPLKRVLFGTQNKRKEEALSLQEEEEEEEEEGEEEERKEKVQTHKLFKSKSILITSIPMGTQDLIWHPSTCIYGQIASCFALSETLNEQQIINLYDLGPNYTNINEILNNNGIIFHYNAQFVCNNNNNNNNNICYDLSTNRLNATLNANYFKIDSFKDAFNSLGSIQLLYPFIYYLSLNKINYYQQWLTPCSSSSSSRSSSSKKNRYFKNPLVFVFELINNLINCNDSLIMQTHLKRTNSLATLNLLVQSLPQELIDLEFLKQIQLLINIVSQEASLIDKSLLELIYKYFVFDFNIWFKSSDYQVKSAHIQYVWTIIKDNKKYFRKLYGVQFILDTFRIFIDTFESNDNDNDYNCSKILRNSLICLIKYFMQNDNKNGDVDDNDNDNIRHDELQAIVSFISFSSTQMYKYTNIQQDLIDMLINLVESQVDYTLITKNIFYEQSTLDCLCVLLSDTSINLIIKERVCKLCIILINKIKRIFKGKIIKFDLNGLISKLVSKKNANDGHFMYLNDKFIYYLMEIYFLLNNIQISHNNQLIYMNTFNLINMNFNDLFSILDLLMSHNYMQQHTINNELNYLRLKINICSLINQFLSKNTSCISTIVKTVNAWHHVLVQLFIQSNNNNENECINDINENNNNNNNNNMKSIKLTSTPERKRQLFANLKLQQQSSIVKSTDSYTSSYSTSSDIIIIGTHQLQSTMIISQDVPDVNNVSHNNNNVQCATLANAQNTSTISIIQEKDEREEVRSELCELIIQLLVKLTWQQVNVYDSSEQVCKERGEVIACLHSISNDYLLIKPIAYIEAKLFEMYLQLCNFDGKSNRTHLVACTHFILNSKVLVKQIDYLLFTFNKNIINYIDETFVHLLLSIYEQLIEMNNDKLNVIMHNKHVSFVDVSDTNQLSKKTTTTTTTNTRRNTIASTTYKLLLPQQQQQQSSSLVGVDISEQSCLIINLLSKLLIQSNNMNVCKQVCVMLNTFWLNDKHFMSTLHILNSYYFSIALIDNYLIEKKPFKEHKEDEERCVLLIQLLKCILDNCIIIDNHNDDDQNDNNNNNNNNSNNMALIKSNLIKLSFDITNDNIVKYYSSVEWRKFIDERVMPKQNLIDSTHETIEMKMWLMNCQETQMISIHKRNRVYGEAKIKFENTLVDVYKRLVCKETLRFNKLLQVNKYNKLIANKCLNSHMCNLTTNECCVWFNDHFELDEQEVIRERVRERVGDGVGEGEEQDDCMNNNNHTKRLTRQYALSNRENKYRMRCRLVQTTQLINVSHLEASKSRDFYENDSNITQSFKQRSVCKNDEQQSLASTSPLGDSIDLSQLDKDKEKLLITNIACDLVTVMCNAINGKFELTNKCIYFYEIKNDITNEITSLSSSSSSFHLNNNNNNSIESFNKNVSSSSSSNHNMFNNNILRIPLNFLKEIQLRKFNLRASALELFLNDNSNYFINFKNKQIRNKIFNKIQLLNSKLSTFTHTSITEHASDLIKTMNATQKWINRDLSNFDYLMLLNTIAGRTYNDLAQYPIFPWILNDYKSNKLDLNLACTYRDLSKPIGALNVKYAEYIRQKFNSFEDTTGTNMKAFHYGTHYSNSASVMHYLIRLEPYTSLHIQLQGNIFDVADRQFHSIENTWQMLVDNQMTSDVKELIPEFFYLPEMFENVNKLDLGILQSTHTHVNNVCLPAWCSSYEQFVWLHRKALESDYVSEHLNEWIDLIFGYKQRGKEAENALNVFMECTYENVIDLDSIENPLELKAYEDMLSNFGQTPTQLFKEPHAKRKTLKQALLDWQTQLKPISLFYQLNCLKAYYVNLNENDTPSMMNMIISSSSNNKSSSSSISSSIGVNSNKMKIRAKEDPIVFIQIPSNLNKSFMQQGPTDPLLTISQSGLIGLHGWQAFEQSYENGNMFTFEKDPSFLSAENTRKSLRIDRFDPRLIIDRKLFVVTHDFKLLVSGGYRNSHVQVYSLVKNRIQIELNEHRDVVTCLAIDSCDQFIISGSRDKTCALWRVQHDEQGICISVHTTPVHVLYGHLDEVTCVDLSIEFDLALSGSKDGTINMHNIYNGHFIKTISFNNNNINNLDHIHLNNNNNYNNNNHNKCCILNIKLNEQRHFIVYSQLLLSFNNNNNNNNYNSDNNCDNNQYLLSTYSINGKLVCQININYPIDDLIVTDTYCILALDQSNKQHSYDLSKTNYKYNLNEKSENVFKSKLVFKELIDLNTIQSMQLRAQIKCLFLTKEHSHLLVGIRDENLLVVITGDMPSKIFN